MLCQMVKVYFTFIRHGESTDNLRAIWAGWRDAPLSQHAKGLAKAHADTRYTAILSSPLMRALSTAEAVRDVQRDPSPPINTSLLLREQYFGVAEGKRYRTVRESGLSLEEHFAQELYPAIRERHLKFPDGESRDDVAERANQAIDELLIPYVQTIVAIVSHGLFIREITIALMRRGVANQTGFKGVGPLRNTGWTRLVVEANGQWDNPTIEPWSSDIFEVRLVDYHRFEHLSRTRTSDLSRQARQKAGMGSMAHDPKQGDIRTFFNKKAPKQS
ncbi:phosphoglycerate mutase-like protein [Amanita rubescens]|nr:phosphoglycerate mutase-like protein [Amanita rubescens]